MARLYKNGIVKNVNDARKERHLRARGYVDFKDKKSTKKKDTTKKSQ